MKEKGREIQTNTEIDREIYTERGSKKERDREIYRNK